MAKKVCIQSQTTWFLNLLPLHYMQCSFSYNKIGVRPKARLGFVYGCMVLQDIDENLFIISGWKSDKDWEKKDMWFAKTRGKLSY